MNKLTSLYISYCDAWRQVILKRIPIYLTTSSKLQPTSCSRICGSHSGGDLEHSDRYRRVKVSTFQKKVFHQSSGLMRHLSWKRPWSRLWLLDVSPLFLGLLFHPVYGDDMFLRNTFSPDYMALYPDECRRTACNEQGRRQSIQYNMWCNSVSYQWQLWVQAKR